MSLFAVPFLTSAVVFSIAIPNLGLADTYKATLIKNTTVNNAVYQASGQDYQYSAVEKTQESEQAIHGTGPLSALSRPMAKETSKVVVGRDIKGHDRLTLEKAGDGNVYLSGDLLVDDRLEGIHVKFTHTYRAKVRMISGNWDDYLAGETIKFALNAEDSQEMFSSGVKMLEAVFEDVRKKVDRQLRDAGASISKIRIDRFETVGSGVIEANLDEIKIEGAGTRATISFRIKL